MKPIISICIPCCKRLEYIRKTLDSIYNTNSEVSLCEYEVIISDNDEEEELSILKEEYGQNNFHYYNTKCVGFMNSFYSLTYGQGEYLLLHNSQELLKKGSLRYIIDLVKSNREKYLFFSSGFLLNGKNKTYSDFDSFMKNVSYWSSWSNAFGIWRTDFEKVKDAISLNELFPHTSLLITQYYHKGYLVCDVPLFETQFVKGRSGHNKFHAFSYEYPSIVDYTYKQGHITDKTRDKILKDILYDYLPLLYFNVKLAKRESWSSDGFEKDLEVYYPKRSFTLIKLLSIISPIKVYMKKVRRKWNSYSPCQGIRYGSNDDK